MAPKKKKNSLKRLCGNLLKRLLFLLISLTMLGAMAFLMASLSGCQTAPPDVPMCVEFGPDRGKCAKIISGEEIEINEEKKFEGKTWWEMRPAMLMMPASSWAQIKSYIVKTCKKYGNCQKEVASWDRTVNIIDETLQKKESNLP